MARWRWKGVMAWRARLAVLRVVAELAEQPSMFAAGTGLHDIEAAARAAGLSARWEDDTLIVGNPGALAVLIGPRQVEVELVDAKDLARWRMLLDAEVLAAARVVHAAKPRLGRTHKLGARVSTHAAAKLRAYAERLGVSEAHALDNLLRALP